MYTWIILQDWQKLGHKMSFGEFKKTEILSNIFSYYSNTILEVNYKKTNSKNHEHVQDKNMLGKKQ